MMKCTPSANLNSHLDLRGLFTCLAIALAAHATKAHAALIVEAEPNNGFATASALSPGNVYVSNIAAAGDLDWYAAAGDLDWYAAAGATTGHLVFAMADTQISTASQDVTLWAIDNTLAIMDFDTGSGPSDSSVIAGTEIPVDGNLYLLTAETTGLLEITPYMLYHLIVDPADAVAESESNDSIGEAENLGGPLVTGEVSGIDVDLFAFEALAGQTIVVMCDDDPDHDSVNTDTGLQIIDSDGVTILATGDNVSGNEANAAGPAQAAANGTFYVRIINGGAADTDYRFVVLVDGKSAEAAQPVVVPCATDADADGVCDDVDACQGNNAFGDADGDGYCDDVDTCPTTANVSQADFDGDGLGDACDAVNSPLCGLGGLSFAPMMLASMGLMRRRRQN